MGWTGYPNMKAQEAIAEELRGTEVLARSGNWVMWRNSHEHVGLTYFLTERKDGYVYVKGVDITMGPGKIPPRTIARKYLAEYGFDYDAAGGTYGADLLRRASEFVPRTKVIPGHTAFRIPEDEYGLTWADDVPMAGEYVWLGGFRALRMVDRQHVRLPRNWRRRWLYAEELAV